jgi:S-adenosylmethionine:tRNA ribosyltransferase-isomerase
MNILDFDYELPEELIAQEPIEPRDSSRVLVYNRESGEISHSVFRDIFGILRAGDLLVVNNTKVMPARFYDEKGIEILLLKRLNLNEYEVLLKPAKKVPVGSVLKVSDELSVEVKEVLEDGVRRVEMKYKGELNEILSRVGEMPLPPYIKKKLEKQDRYQTVYAKTEGSAAAPTAGLHFTEKLMEDLRAKGVEFCEILLHVGLGTFRPVKEEKIENHKMHSEYCEISEKAAEIINKAKREGRRVIAVGTTSVRTLESMAENGRVKSGSRDTDVFIYPPYQYKIVDGIITNFHLPKSTLLMLVAAFIGREKMLEIYEIAKTEKYRFFSFGDAMLLI